MYLIVLWIHLSKCILQRTSLTIINTILIWFYKYNSNFLYCLFPVLGIKPNTNDDQYLKVYQYSEWERISHSNINSSELVIRLLLAVLIDTFFYVLKLVHFSSSQGRNYKIKPFISYPFGNKLLKFPVLHRSILWLLL